MLNTIKVLLGSVRHLYSFNRRVCINGVYLHNATLFILQSELHPDAGFVVLLLSVNLYVFKDPPVFSSRAGFPSTRSSRNCTLSCSASSCYREYKLSNECREVKTIVIISSQSIQPGNAMNQSELEVKTCSRCEAQETCNR